MPKGFYLLCLLWLSNQNLDAYPCNEILFKYAPGRPAEIISEELMIFWEYNEHCGEPEDRGELFLVKLEDAYKNVLSVDTVKGFYYTIEPRMLDQKIGITMISVCQLGDDYGSYLGLISINPALTIPSKPRERLNFFLLNGYFLNALPIIDQLGMKDDLKRISEELALMFPPNYPGNVDFFSLYLSQESDNLLKMSYVEGLDSFIKELNKGTKKDHIKEPPFNIEFLISPNNDVVSVELGSRTREKLIEQLIQKLRFDNTHDQNVRVLIKVGRTQNGRKYLILNERALKDPNSKDYRKKYPHRGGVN
ncbi:MAG: hypothetical protein JXR10_10175 [Cyclobacteriaceae bacterium]